MSLAESVGRYTENTSEGEGGFSSLLTAATIERSYIAITLHNEVGILPSSLLQLFWSRREGRAKSHLIRIRRRKSFYG